MSERARAISRPKYRARRKNFCWRDSLSPSRLRENIINHGIYRENITLHRITSLETDIAFVYTVRTYLHTLAHIYMRVHMLYIYIYIYNI